ncbi:MAG TPA: ATP-binding protein [Alphaproteobacteria bacterium]|nr:ATP-binding protein [Alphaproteobacteria bacterium]HQS94514.1 ATP-binding protein [Alphaproteobacteria bacterium]
MSLFPAVLLNGARQVGKSTLLSHLFKDHLFDHYFTLDDITTLTACKTDPIGFLNQFQGKVAIDEIQRCPELLMTLKHTIDLNRQDSGRFLLTGSANLLSYPNVCESLAGRIDIIELEGLSAGEIFDKPYPSSFLKDLFSITDPIKLTQKWSHSLQNQKTLTKTDLLNLIFYGGFPDVFLKQDEYFRSHWFQSYLTAYTERDVRDLNRMLDVVGFTKVFKLLCLQTGQLININNLAVESGLDQRTVSRYLEILSLTFQLTILQPFSANTRKRLVKTPKIYVNDSGYASFFSGIDHLENLLHNSAYGHLLETWVFSELRKLLHLETGIDIFFYRTHLGKEIDFILTKGTRVIGIECKASESLQKQDFTGLKDLQSENPNALGIILYGGQTVLQVASQIIAVPFSIFL